MDQTFKIDNSVLLDPFSTEYAKQNTNQLSGKSARLVFTGATESQRHSVNEKIVKSKS